jgi:YbbR-like protein
MIGFFRRTIAHNFGLKLLALALAIGFWVALAHDPVSEVALEVPIIFRNVPDNLGMSYEQIPRAQILLRGPQRAVRRLQSSDIQAEIDLTGGQPGERIFSSSVVEVHRPHDLQVLSIGPEKFAVTFVELTKSSGVTSPATHP